MNLRPRLNHLLYILLRATWLIVGACIGAVAYILIDSNSELVLDKSLFWGIALGIGFCILAVFILIMLRPREMEPEDPPQAQDLTEARDAIVQLGHKLDLDDTQIERLLGATRRQGKALLALGLRLWSGAAALAMAVAIVGSIITMITALAAIRQVNRIDTQNALLETQIEEAQASRAANLFAAQLPSLLAQIDAERIVHEEKFGPFTEDSPPNADLWTPSINLRARIQTVIDTSEPYLSDPEVDRAIMALNSEIQRKHEIQVALLGTDAGVGIDTIDSLESKLIPAMKFSPQRAQLLRVLIAAKVDLGATEPSLDFSQGDFRGFDLGEADFHSIDLGKTILADSNFLGAQLGPLKFERTNLNRSVFGGILDVSVGPDGIAGLLGIKDSPEGLLRFNWDQSNLRIVDQVLILREDDGPALKKDGWLGNDAIGQMPTNFVGWGFTIGLDILTYADLLDEAETMDGMVYRMGLLSPVHEAAGNLATMDVALREEFEGCDSLSAENLEELRDLAWYAIQDGTHPIWLEIRNMVIFAAIPEVAACIYDYGDVAREPPRMAKRYMKDRG